MLAVLQDVCEILPVSNSAHVIVVEKLMRLDPSAPEMTLLLVMFHTVKMLAVIVRHWNSWRGSHIRSSALCRQLVKRVTVATTLSGVIRHARPDEQDLA